jgi:DNA/RNA endonuclease G (NUC1)
MKQYSAPLYLFLSIVFCFSGNTAIFAQEVSKDTITIKHKYYTTTFSRSKHIPIVVKYWLTKAMLTCQNRVMRTNKFRPDPQLPDYTNMDEKFLIKRILPFIYISIYL